MRLVHDGQADAVVTAGHTGAGVASAILHLGRLPGVDRPALAIQMVTETGPFVLLDIGATTDSTGEQLYQYAAMGALFAERVLGVSGPPVALLSIGEETGKGDARVQRRPSCSRPSTSTSSATSRARTCRHMADVVVCDASVGNVVIKFFEGLVAVHLRPAPQGVQAPAVRAPGYLLMRPGIRRIRKSSTTSASAARRCWVSTARCSSPTVEPSGG